MDKERLKKAQQLQRQGDLTEALALYQQLLRDNQDNTDLLHQIAILYAQQEDYDNAWEYLERALQNAPDSAAIHNSKGNILLRQGQSNAALLEYQKAVNLDRHYAIAYNNIGRCFYLQEKFIAAEKAYAKALELNPQLGDAYYNSGVLWLKLGDLDKSQVFLKKALELNPRNPAVYGQLAQIDLQKADYVQAIDWLRKRLLLTPHHVDSWHYLGLAHFALDQFDDAIHSFEKVLQITHLHPECYEHLAISYLKLEDKEKALTYFFRQLEIQPTANAYYNIGVLLNETGRQRDAMDYFKHTLILEPLHLPAHLNLGVLYLKGQQLSEALQHYQQADAIKPHDPEIQHILMALNQNRLPDKAPAEYLKNLFDQYAEYYDKHLTQSLRYKVPQQIHAAVYQEIQTENVSWNILDLGCGTGLCGELFKEFSKKLSGVDISQEMINYAKVKNIYDELRVADIEQALADYRDLDLVIAADVFTYIGDLDEIFSRVKQALTENGLFAFSVEKTEKSAFELQASIRYAHSQAYLESLISKYHYKIRFFEEIILRTQKDQPVKGYLVLLKI